MSFLPRDKAVPCVGYAGGRYRVPLFSGFSPKRFAGSYDCCRERDCDAGHFSAGISVRETHSRFPETAEFCQNICMTVSTTAKLFSDRIGRIEVSATMAVTAEAAKLR